MLCDGTSSAPGVLLSNHLGARSSIACHAGNSILAHEVNRMLDKRTNAEARLRHGEPDLIDAQRIAGIGSWQWDLKTDVVAFSPDLYRLLGMDSTRRALNRADLVRCFVAESEARLKAGLDRAVLTGEPCALDIEALHPDGTRRWMVAHCEARRNVDGRVSGLIGTMQDITERKRTEAALHVIEEQFNQLARHIPQMFWITGVAQRDVIYLSPAFEQITGYSIESAKASSRVLVEMVHPDDRRRVQTARKHAASGGYDEIFRLVRRDDRSVRWVHDRAFPIRDTKGEVYRVAGIVEDITERKQAEERVLHLAHYDSLTGLPNRVLFQDRLKQTLVQAHRNQKIVGVLFMDLDGFKTINDTLGHAYGDKLLQLASNRLTQCVRGGDTVARFGGDEFALILSDLAAGQDAALVAQKLLDAIAAPFVLDANETYVTASVGITLYPVDSDGISALIKNADAAMYGAKAAGRNNYQFYTAEMNRSAQKKMFLETGLRRALEREEFVLHYQPKIDVLTGRTTGLEALLRWQSSSAGLVSPDEFISLLEETGLIMTVGSWVVRAACLQISEWQRAGVPMVPVAINISGRQFQQPGLDNLISSTLKAFNVDPCWLEIEITESSLMHKPVDAIAVLENLRALGIRISVDDFGTGYSSLSYLKRFPLNALKIDRSFVRDITVDADDAAITRAVLTLAHSLNLKVIAEGVETEEQLAFLHANHCDEAQGYLFSKPLSAADCTTLLAANRRLHKPAFLSDSITQPIVLLVDEDANSLISSERLLRGDGYRVLTASSPRAAFDLLAMHAVKVVVSDQEMAEMPCIEFFKRVRVMYPQSVRSMWSGLSDVQTVTAAINEGEIHRFFVKRQDDHLLRKEIRKAIRR